MPLHAIRTGHGPRLVLVHGFTQTSASWARIAAHLAERYEVACVDAPGHGRSSHIRTDLWDGAAMLAALGPAVFIGYSMGARYLLHTAIAHPRSVSGLVLLGGTAGIDDPDERAARRRSDADLADSIERDGTRAFLDRWMAQAMFRRLEPTSADLEARRANDPSGLAASLRLAGTGSQDPPLWDRLHEIDVPTLVLAGEDDTKFAGLGQRMAASIGANATFTTVPGAGHAAHLECPDEFNSLVDRWLADLS